MTTDSIMTRAVKIAFFSDLNGVRFLLAVAETMWFISLMWPGDTFARPTYSVMGAVMAEPAWALLFLITASCQWGILFSGKYHDRWAVMFAGWNSALWWFVVISMYLGVYPPPAGISGELALAFGASWIWVRSGYMAAGRRATDGYR